MSERHLKPLVSLSVDEDSDNYSSEGDEPIGLSSIRVTVTASKKKNEKVRSSGEVQPSKMKRCRLCSEGTSTDVTLKQAEKREQIRYYWNEEEEISLLKGIIDFEDVTGMSPFDDSHGFYEYLKSSFSFEVNTKRLIDKIRHLESKYMNKEKNSFFKAHDQTCFKLAKSIWVAEGKSNEKSKKMDSLKQDDKSKMVIHGGDVTNSERTRSSFDQLSVLVWL